MKIVCIGGGPAGLYFGLLMKLQDPANQVVVLDRNPALTLHEAARPGYRDIQWPEPYQAGTDALERAILRASV